MSKQVLKNTFLYACKGLGLFKMARHLTANRLRILCYHGIAAADEHRWRPALYIAQGTFTQRMRFLRDAGYPVLDLDEAIERRAEGTLPASATVITFDDGFKDFYDLAWPVMRDLNLPSTLYVTTYHAVKQTPIFRLALSYLFWKTTRRDVNLRAVALLPTGLRQWFQIIAPNLEDRIVRHAETNLSDAERMELLEDLYECFGVDWQTIESSRLFRIVDTEEMREMARGNVAIELHTHRHRFPTDVQSALAELFENGELLKQVGSSARHFCYPSGIWSKSHLPVLQAAGIKSATTCNEGLNGADQDPLTLKRFLDGSQVSQIRFEAEICGFMDLLRDLKKFQRSIRTKMRGVNALNPMPAHGEG